MPLLRIFSTMSLNSCSRLFFRQHLRNAIMMNLIEPYIGKSGLI